MEKYTYYTQLINMIANEKSIDQLLAYIQSVTHQSMILTDEQFVLIGYALKPNDQKAKEELRLLEETIIFKKTDLDQIKSQLRDKNNDDNQIKIEEGMNLTYVSICAKEQTIAYCWVIDPDEDRDDVPLMNELLPLVKISIIKYRENKKNRRRSQDDFVTNVLMGNVTDYKEVMNLCEINCFDYQYKRVCIFIKPLKKIGQTPDQQRRRENGIISAIEIIIQNEELYTYKASFNGNIIIFLFFKQEKDNTQLNQYTHTISKKMVEALNQQTIDVQCGIGKCYEGVKTIGKSFKQAIKAINLGSKIKPDCNTYAYYENFVYHLLYDGMSYTQLFELYEETIMKIDEWDKENNGELSITLEKLLENKFKLSDTAQKLHVHRNTLAYRIEKIKEILECDFSDHNENMRIQMGIYSKALIGIYDVF